MYRSKGFTLIDLIIVISILSIIISLAIPTFTNNMKRSKIAELMFNIRKIFDGEVMYFAEEREEAEVPYSQDFVFIRGACSPNGWAPDDDPGVKKRGGPQSFRTDWDLINFTIDSPTYFSFNVKKANSCTARGLVGEFDAPKVNMCDGKTDCKAFQVIGAGDLDGDDINSVFLRAGYASNESDFEVFGMSGVYQDNELE